MTRKTTFSFDAEEVKYLNQDTFEADLTPKDITPDFLTDEDAASLKTDDCVKYYIKKNGATFKVTFTIENKAYIRDRLGNVTVQFQTQYLEIYKIK